MKSWLISVCLTVSVLCLAFEAGAQKTVPFGFHPVKKTRGHVVCPFELRTNLIVVKVLVDKSDTLNFVIDSGVQGVIILDTTLKHSINTKIGRPITIRGLGNEEAHNAFVSIGHTIRFGDIIGYQQNIILLEEDLLNLSEYVGMPIHGIIGSDLFYRFNVKIDYEAQLITLSNPEKYKYKKRKGELLQIYFEKTKPFITLNTVEVNGQKEENLNLLIDTGGAHALMLNREYINPKLLPKKMVDGNLGRGLSGKIDGKMGRVSRLKFASHEFKDVVTTFPDTLFLGTKEERYSLFRQGSIGGEILKRFVVTLNYHQKIMVFKPVKSAIKKPFESDMSGIDLRALGENHNDFEVAHVIPNSAAFIAGILPGDRIIMFNKKLARHISINEFYKELSKKEGYPIDLVILRGNKLEEVNFRLKKMI
jgi:hypothetical protein